MANKKFMNKYMFKLLLAALDHLSETMDVFEFPDGTIWDLKIARDIFKDRNKAVTSTRSKLNAVNKVVNIYTDGSCYYYSSKGLGVGGWAFVLLDGNNNIVAQKSGNARKSTSDRMELMAVIRALHYVHTNIGTKRLKKEKISVNVFTDSKYIIAGAIKHKNLQNQENTNEFVKNSDLWLSFFNYAKNLNLTFHKVKAHSGNELNDLVDSLAKAEVESALNLKAKQPK